MRVVNSNSRREVRLSMVASTSAGLREAEHSIICAKKKLGTRVFELFTLS